MSRDTRRGPRTALIPTVISGVVSGVTRAIIGWLLEHVGNWLLNPAVWFGTTIDVAAGASGYRLPRRPFAASARSSALVDRPFRTHSFPGGPR